MAFAKAILVSAKASWWSGDVGEGSAGCWVSSIGYLFSAGFEVFNQGFGSIVLVKPLAEDVHHAPRVEDTGIPCEIKDYVARLAHGRSLHRIAA
jgi:hypothetical protein